MSGMHTSALATSLTIDAIFIGCLGSHFTALMIFIYGVGATVFAMVVEHRLASLLFRQHADQLAKESLLDHASDGFCDIKASTGIITNASTKLNVTLTGNGQLQGLCFLAFLSTSDDRALFQGLTAASTSDGLKPILVSCRAPDRKEFDAKLIPYASSADHLSFCLQIQGELRKISSPDTILDIDQGQSEILDDATTLAPQAALNEKTAQRVNSSEASFFIGSLSFSQESRDMIHMNGVAIQTDSIPSTEIAVQAGAARPPQIPQPAAHRQRRARVNLRTRKLAMSHFQETPNQTVEILLWELMQKINPRGKGCCYMHIGLLVLQQCISAMSLQECRRELQPYNGWQCEECFALNEDDSDVSDRFCCACLHFPELEPAEQEEALACEAEVESLSAGTDSDSNSLVGPE